MSRQPTSPTSVSVTMHNYVVMVLLLLASAGCDRCSKDKASTTFHAAGSGSAATPRPPRTAPRRWAPPPTPQLPELSAAWSSAEAKKTAESWDAAAEAFMAERARCTDDCLDAQYAVVLARKNAMAAETLPKPKPDEKPQLPPRVKALVDSLDEYVKIAPLSDPDVYDMKFLAANALASWNQNDAIARLEELLRNHRSEPSAEYVANMLLNALVRENRLAELKAWVTELLADTAFLQGKDALRATLETLKAQLAQSGQ